MQDFHSLHKIRRICTRRSAPHYLWNTEVLYIASRHFPPPISACRYWYLLSGEELFVDDDCCVCAAERRDPIRFDGVIEKITDLNAFFQFNNYAHNATRRVNVIIDIAPVCGWLVAGKLKPHNSVNIHTKLKHISLPYRARSIHNPLSN